MGYLHNRDRSESSSIFVLNCAVLWLFLLDVWVKGEFYPVDGPKVLKRHRIPLGSPLVVLFGRNHKKTSCFERELVAGRVVIFERFT